MFRIIPLVLSVFLTAGASVVVMTQSSLNSNQDIESKTNLYEDIQIKSQIEESNINFQADNFVNIAH